MRNEREVERSSLYHPERFGEETCLSTVAVLGASGLTNLLRASALVASLGAIAVAVPARIAAQGEGIGAPEEIVVTARRREERIQDVPTAVSALSSAELDATGVDTIFDLQHRIPALEALTTSSPVQSTFRLRRVGNLSNISTFEPAVGVFIDGAFRMSPAFAVNDFFALERIEVLRGPQGALYGKNTTAGVVAIYTEPPGDDLTGDAEISVGTVGGSRDATSTRFRGGISGPLASTLSGSLGISVLDQENSWTSALVNGGEDANATDRAGVRGQLAWQASDALDLRLIVAAMHEDDKQTSHDITYDPAGFVSRIVLPTSQAAGVSDVCTDNDPDNRRNCLLKAWRTDLATREATLLTNYALANGRTLSAVTSWDAYEFKGAGDDVAQIAAPVLRLHNTLATESFQQDVRFASAANASFEWFGGLFYYESEFKQGDSGNRPIFLFDELSDDPTMSALHQALFGLPVPLPFAAEGQVGTLDGAQDTHYVSVYGHTTWRPMRRFALSSELRWQREEKDAHVIQANNDPSPSMISLLLVPAAVSADGLERSAREPTWSLTPQWFATDTTMLFATFAHGFKSGGFNVGFGRCRSWTASSAMKTSSTSR